MPASAPTELAIFAFEFGPYLGETGVKQGVDVMVSSWRRMAPDTLAGMSKAGGNYLNSQFIAMEAADLGFPEGIALDVNGLVSEGSGENIFVVYRGALYTPPVGASILLGVTRDCVLTLARELGYRGARAEHSTRDAVRGRGEHSSAARPWRSRRFARWTRCKSAKVRPGRSPPASRRRSTTSSGERRQTGTAG